MTQKFIRTQSHDVDPLEQAARIAQALPKGVLLTTKAGDKVDTMTIGWGAVGVCWARPVFTAYVRTGRFTHELLDRNAEFTVNIPDAETSRKILGVAGTATGRLTDKVADLGLTLVEPKAVSVPAIKELPLTLECRVIYRQDQDLAALDPQIVAKSYPDVPGVNPDGSNNSANRDVHTVFMGEIVAAYEIER